MHVEQAVDLMRHVAILTFTARRAGGMMRVLDQLVAIGFMAPIAGRVGAHAFLDLVIGLALVHRMTREASHLAVPAFIARGHGHALVLDRGG